MASISRESVNIASEELWRILEPEIGYLDQDARETVYFAFLQMVHSHGAQRRKSNDFYIIHPVYACIKLAQMKLDADTLAASLLHDVPEDTETGLDVIEKNFGKEIAFLVSGVTKLGKVKYHGDERYAENLRRMFVAMSKDVRVIFIKLADRIHNLETLEYVNPLKAQRIARESLEIYAPISERLGIGLFQSKIEDMSFPILYPEDYQTLVSMSDIEIEKRQTQLDSIKKFVKELLEIEGLQYRHLQGRAKRYYSIYKKIYDKKKQLRDIHDLVALRVVVDSIEECYEVLSLVHREFDAIPGRVKDYIRLPKPNGYQSIHTSVKDRKSGVVFEFQIRTHEMHEYAEFGIAAHWAYKEKGENGHQFLKSENLKWIQEIVDLGRQTLTDEEYLSRVRLDLFQDRIFILTPKGDVIDLPTGSTPLDFAYQIHEDIGSHAVMAKVNGQPVKLTHRLLSGDKIEIITDKKQQPKPDWLHYVATTSAAKKIRVQLRKIGISI